MRPTRRGLLAWLRSPLSSARNLDRVLELQEQLVNNQRLVLGEIQECSSNLKQFGQAICQLEERNATRDLAWRGLCPGRGELGWDDPRTPASLFRAQCLHAQIETIDIIRTEMAEAVCELDHRKFLLHALSCARPDGAVLEFGVFSGTTLRWMSENRPERAFFGFDSFRGLPTQWAGNRLVDFDLDGNVPVFSSNVEIIVGQFHETLPAFVRSLSRRLGLVHIDCDLYESTKVVLDALAPCLSEGTVLVFDEYFNYPGFQGHEKKALQEFLADSGLRIRWFSHCGERAAGELVDGTRAHK